MMESSTPKRVLNPRTYSRCKLVSNNGSAANAEPISREDVNFKSKSLNIRSIQEVLDTSSDEEWVFKTSRYFVKSYSKTNRNSSNLDEKLKEVVSPLKLLRLPEYEVNKLPGNKKSESAVSPIVIKRKDLKKATNEEFPELPPSSKYNMTLKMDETASEVITPQKRLEAKDTPAKNKISRKKNALEDSFEETISNLRIQNTPLKTKEESTSSDEVLLSKRLEEIEQRKEVKSTKPATLPKEPPQGTPKRITRKATVKVDDHKMDCNPETPLKVTTNTSAKKKLSLSDHEMDELASPPKRKPEVRDSLTSASRPVRKSTRKSIKSKMISDSDFVMGTTISPPKRRATRSSTVKASVTNFYKEDSEIELSSPEMKTPRRSVIKPRESFIDSPDLWRQVLTPRKSARKKLDLSTPTSVKKVGSGFLTPVVPEKARRSILGTPSSILEETRASLHTSNIPSSLPCREKEFDNISKFLVRKIEDKAGGCMYISGVPGTGKTATVHAVIRSLQEKAVAREMQKFDFIEVNGLRLTEPRQAYSRIWQELSGEKKSADHAMKALEKKFNSSNKRPCVLLIDELDYLCNRRQDVIYNILEWSTKSTSALTVLTIANTMDMPERTLKGKVTSRMGLTRLVFQPYTFHQLQQIVMNRIGNKSSFHVDAVQLVARKVAAVSGDARRALDICRRLTEMVKSDSDIIKVTDVEKVISQIFSGARVLAIKKCSIMSQYLLRAMRDEFQRTGVEESTVGQVYSQLSSICAFECCEPPSVGIVLSLCTVLADSGLILAEKSRTDMNRKISLNVSADDIFYACNT